MLSSFNQNMEFKIKEAPHIKEITNIRDYKIIKRIGFGASGLVFKVSKINDSKNQIYILKQIPYTDINMEETNKKIKEAKNEALILSELSCKYIVKYYDSFVDEDSNLNIIMEYCENGDLNALIQNLKKQNTYLSEDDIWFFFIQISFGLAYIHSKNILHRDLKPMNIFLTQKNHIKIGDLGVAKILKTNSDAHSCIGTPSYMSPEVCQEKPYNSKSDVWALGCILYELCTLDKPFVASNPAALILKIINGKYKSLDEVDKSNRYSKDLSLFIDNILQKNLNTRPYMKDIINSDIFVDKANIFGFSNDLKEINSIYNKSCSINNIINNDFISNINDDNDNDESYNIINNNNCIKDKNSSIILKKNSVNNSIKMTNINMINSKNKNESFFTSSCNSLINSNNSNINNKQVQKVQNKNNKKKINANSNNNQKGLLLINKRNTYLNSKSPKNQKSNLINNCNNNNINKANTKTNYYVPSTRINNNNNNKNHISTGKSTMDSSHNYEKGNILTSTNSDSMTNFYILNQKGNFIKNKNNKDIVSKAIKEKNPPKYIIKDNSSNNIINNNNNNQKNNNTRIIHFKTNKNYINKFINNKNINVNVSTNNKNNRIKPSKSTSQYKRDKVSPFRDNNNNNNKSKKYNLKNIIKNKKTNLISSVKKHMNNRNYDNNNSFNHSNSIINITNKIIDMNKINSTYYDYISLKQNKDTNSNNNKLFRRFLSLDKINTSNDSGSYINLSKRKDYLSRSRRVNSDYKSNLIYSTDDKENINIFSHFNSFNNNNKKNLNIIKNDFNSANQNKEKEKFEVVEIPKYKTPDSSEENINLSDEIIEDSGLEDEDDEEKVSIVKDDGNNNNLKEKIDKQKEEYLSKYNDYKNQILQYKNIIDIYKLFSLYELMSKDKAKTEDITKEIENYMKNNLNKETFHKFRKLFYNYIYYDVKIENLNQMKEKYI